MQNEASCRPSLFAIFKINQTGVFSLVRLKPFETYFYFVMFSISFSNFPINNGNYLLLKQLTDWARKYKLFLLPFAKTYYHFVMIFRLVYIAYVEFVLKGCKTYGPN